MLPVKDNSTKTIKYVARSIAKVIDNADPYNRGRIRVFHPQMGETGWIDYLKDPGGFNVPSIGDQVYVEAESGAHTHLIASGNRVTGSDAVPNIPGNFQRVYPTNRGLYTPDGHLIELDDGISNLEPSSTVTSTPQVGLLTQGIRLTTIDGNQINLNDGKSAINIQDMVGNSITLTYDVTSGFKGISINSPKSEVDISAHANINILSSNGIVNIMANQDVTVNASGKCTIVASEIDLNLGNGAYAPTPQTILTTSSDPVVDSIFGTPTQGILTVKAGN